MAGATAHSRTWRINAGFQLPLDRPQLMGILNVTPDSFSDGGAYTSPEDAAAAAVQMKQAGASIIDVGGESTRPGALPVDPAEQIRRTTPVIHLLRQQFSREEFLISIDTTVSEVADAALNAGADIINDISAGRDDIAMLPLAAQRGCGIILMHRRDPPQRDSYSDQYQAPPDYGGNVVQFVRQFLTSRVDAALIAGIVAESIVIDPGLGFGKSVEQNFELLRHVGELLDMGYPVLCGASRKSFVGAVSGQKNPSDRVTGSIAISVAQYLAGVRIFRVHDVQAHREALAVAASLGDDR